jgi:hypothetical protein
MAAKNPRLTITLNPSLAAQLRRLSELTGNSQSALISELLEGSGEVFTRLIQILEAAELAKESIKGGVSREMREAQELVENQIGLFVEVGDRMTGDLVEAVEKVKRRRAKNSPGGGASTGDVSGLPTPLSNRGVRSLAKTAKTSTKSRG